MNSTTSSAAQANAVRVTLEGTRRERLATAARAIVRLCKDPEDTEQVFILGITLNVRKLPQLVTRFVSEPSGLELLHERPSIDKRSVDFAHLRKLPADTLGGAYARFLEDNHLDPDLFQAPPGLPLPVAFIAQRLRQTHDLWHVVAGFGTDVASEVALQAFTYGQIDTPSSAAITLFGLARIGWREPRLFREVVKSFRRGRNAAFLPVVRWETMWETPLSEVRDRLGVYLASN
jgi:ubiquinone biosynthesis protein COQ4